MRHDHPAPSDRAEPADLADVAAAVNCTLELACGISREDAARLAGHLRVAPTEEYDRLGVSKTEALIFWDLRRRLP